MDARLAFGSALAVVKTLLLLRSGEDCGTLLRREGFCSVVLPGISRVGFATLSVVQGLGELLSKRDMERPLLALRGRLLWILARKERCWLIGGLMLRAWAALSGLADRSTLEKFHLGWSSLEIPRPTAVDADAGGELKLIEVKSVSAWEKALDAMSSKTEVSPLNRLVPDTRRGLDSAGLLMTAWNFLVALSSNGSGGIGMVGACPGCWLHRLLDLRIRANCVFAWSALSPDAVTGPCAVFVFSIDAIAPWEKLRCCPWKNGLGWSCKGMISKLGPLLRR